MLSICITVVGLSLGYAALQQSLQINAEATVGSLDTNWKVEFTEDETGKTGVATGNAEAGTMELNNTDVTINGVKLNAPGDTVTYTFYVENKGTIDAKLASYTPKENPSITGSGESDPKSADEALVKSNYDFSIKWADNEGTITPGDELNHGNKKKIKVTISYKENANKLPTKEVTISNLGATLLYEQADAA